MLEEEIKNYLKAGRIAASALKFALNKIHEGMPIIELCEMVENYIIANGAELAFPCNVSINYVAAHDTAELNETSEIPKKSVVKIDVGAHINGYIADTAKTVIFDEKYEKLRMTTEKALIRAIENVKTNIPLSFIGKVVEKIAKENGFNPIKNLAGHLMKRYLLHAGKSVPNFDDGSTELIKENEVFAIEPFLTTGSGYVKEINTVKIFSLKQPLKVKSKFKSLFDEIWKKRYTLPFCLRWYKEKINYEELNNEIKNFNKRKFIVGYPVLVEESKGIVAQEEHTVIVLSNEIIITTKIE
jgi:methionyl aminopeptidase